jgi:serine/threonine protein phosphatase 1
VPPGRRIYAIGDIHGRDDLLKRLHRLILADACRLPADVARVVVYLGDYVDRGPASAAVLDRLVHGRLPGFATVALMGNHEDMMQGFLAGGGALPWLLNGGSETLASYGIRPAGRIDAVALEVLRGRLGDALPPGHAAFLAGLGLYHEEGDYVFVHAGVRPGVPLARQARRDLIWIREPFLAAADAIGRTVVHGHTITDEPDVGPGRIGIDTGAFLTGRLTCVVLEGCDRRFLHT